MFFFLNTFGILKWRGYSLVMTSRIHSFFIKRLVKGETCVVNRRSKSTQRQFLIDWAAHSRLSSSPTSRVLMVTLMLYSKANETIRERRRFHSQNNGPKVCPFQLNSLKMAFDIIIKRIRWNYRVSVIQTQREKFTGGISLRTQTNRWKPKMAV